MNIDVRTLIDLASAAHDFHKAHHRIDVAVAQQTDALGIHLHVDLQAAIPEGALIFGRVSGAWLGKLSAVDDVLFRDADGNFVTLGPIVGQRGAIYIPYGAARNRGPGLYTLEMSIRLVCSDPANPTELAHASYKLALPEQRPWRRMEFFAPLVTLCMAVVRVDNEVLPAEVRGLKALLGESVALSGQDLTDLRDLMKAPVPTDLAEPLAILALRMPMLTPESTLELLADVARLDGPVNAHEVAVLTHVAALLGVPHQRRTALLSAPTSRPLALTTRAVR